MNPDQLRVGLHLVKCALYATVVYLKELARLVDDADKALHVLSKQEHP